jgi:DNA-binding NtrC family response regulator
MPPLAERTVDLPLLGQALLEGINAAGNKQVGGFTPEALDLLAGYAWPGNCDELTAVVAESHARAAGTEIGPRDLPKRLHLAADASHAPPRVTEPIHLEEFLARTERELIERALGRAKGNKSRAAKLLGLTRPRLYRRMVQLGLEPPAGGAATNPPEN